MEEETQNRRIHSPYRIDVPLSAYHDCKGGEASTGLGCHVDQWEEQVEGPTVGCRGRSAKHDIDANPFQKKTVRIPRSERFWQQTTIRQ